MAWQEEMSALARRTGMRVVGPNCMGLINVRRRLPGTFTPSAAGFGLVPGRISVVSQSGAFGGYCLSLIRQRGLGLNLWITTGNQCDVDVADCIEHFALDAETQVIMRLPRGGGGQGAAVPRPGAGARARQARRHHEGGALGGGRACHGIAHRVACGLRPGL